MARIRTIKPEMPQSESLGRVSREARLCFILLWTQADDSGRLRGNSRMLASLLYPYDDDAKGLIGGWLTELQTEHCIRCYAVDGDHFIDIPKWLDHQKIDHPSTSKLPAFAEESREIAKPREDSPRTKDQGKEGTKDQGGRAKTREGERQIFESWFAGYPRKIGKGQALKAFAAALKKTDHATLIEGRDRYCAEVAGKEQAHVAHPATWLNGERWTDAPGANVAATEYSPTLAKKSNGHAAGNGGGLADTAELAAQTRKRRAEKIREGDPKGGTSFIIPKFEVQRMMDEGLLTLADLQLVGLAQ